MNVTKENCQEAKAAADTADTAADTADTADTAARSLVYKEMRAEAEKVLLSL